MGAPTKYSEELRDRAVRMALRSQARTPSARAVSDAATLAKIKKVHQDNYAVCLLLVDHAEFCSLRRKLLEGKDQL